MSHDNDYWDDDYYLNNKDKNDNGHHFGGGMPTFFKIVIGIVLGIIILGFLVGVPINGPALKFLGEIVLFFGVAALLSKL